MFESLALWGKEAIPVAVSKPLRAHSALLAMNSDNRPPVLDLFWDCLAASDSIDPTLLEELRESWTPDAWRPVGEILIRSGVLTLRQVAGLIGMQATEPHMRIGDLAVREGLCTAKQIEVALRVQRESCPGPVELLLRDDRVEGDQLLDALLMYARFLEGRLLRKTQGDGELSLKGSVA